MSESYKSPDERVQMFEFPNSAQIEETLTRVAEENNFRIFGKDEFDKIGKRASQEGNPILFATALINEIQTGEKSQITIRLLRHLRLKNEISDNEYIFASKHRFRKGVEEARIILDAIVVDPASAKWGHKFIDDTEKQFLSK